MPNKSIECYTNQSRLAIEITEMLLITVFPLAYMLSAMCNLICVWIFSTNIFKNNIYRYLTASAICDILYSLVFMVVPFSKCSISCTWISDFYQKYIIYIFAKFLLRVFDTINSLICVFVLVDRYLILKNKTPKCFVRHRLWVFYGTLAVIIAYSVAIFMPNFFIQKLVNVNRVFPDVDYLVCDKIKKPIKYVFKLTDNKSLIILTLILQYGTTLVIFVATVVLTCRLIMELRRNYTRDCRIIKFRYRKKWSTSESTIQIQPDESSKTIDNKTTLLIVWVAIFLLASRLTVDTMYAIFLFYNPYTLSYNVLILCLMPLELAFHGSTIFIYYNFNNCFAEKLRGLLFFRRSK
jgi:hypothetical protein